MLSEKKTDNFEFLIEEKGYSEIFDKLESKGFDIRINDRESTFNLYLKKGKDLQNQTILELNKLINSTLFGSNFCSEKIIKNNYFSNPDSYNFIIRKATGKKIVVYAQVLSLQKTNTAYYSIAAFLPEVQSLGFYSLSTCLSIIYSLYKKHDSVVGRTQNPIVIEILSKYGFYYPKMNEKLDKDLISKAKEAMNEYMGKRVKINNWLIMDGEEMNTTGHMPAIQKSNDPNINEFISKYMSGFDRLVMIKPVDEEKDHHIICEKLSRIFEWFI
jgi:hypothetical protein